MSLDGYALGPACSLPIPTCLPVTPRMSHSVPGQSLQAAICSWMQWELSPPGSWLVSVWLSPGALRGTLQVVIGFPNSACSFITASHSDAGRAFKALCPLPAPTLANCLFLSERGCCKGWMLPLSAVGGEGQEDIAPVGPVLALCRRVVSCVLVEGASTLGSAA